MLQPVAHALLQAREDIEAAIGPLSAAQLSIRPANAASVGFHARHLAGSLDRLLTYARGEQLSPEQVAYLKAEMHDSSAEAGTLIAFVHGRLDAALDQVKHTPEQSLLEARRVGRQGLLSNTIGLLFHAAEHTTRHTGQIITTARIVARS